MNPNLKDLLLIIGISAPVGLAVGLIARKRFPESCKSFTKWSLDANWKTFTAGAVFFSIFALVTFLNGDPYLGSFFVAFALLQLWALFFHGFRSLDDSTKALIDDSDPSKLLPFRFWK